MRQYIRHPAAVPVTYQCGPRSGPKPTELVEVNRSGISFTTDEPLKKGHIVQVSIGIGSPPYETCSQIAWCRAQDDHFLVGLHFDNEEQAYAVRMIEQMCHIEQYRQRWQREGRLMTPDEAAAEWIDLHACDFPSLTVESPKN